MTAGRPRIRSRSSPTSPLTAGAEVVGAEWQNRRHVDPNWYIGKGKAEELAGAKRETGFDVLIADDELSPAQQRALEELLKVKVIDRSRLILDIFALHAQTHEGRLQVELAQLEYQLPRLTKLWTHLSRTGGGIGTRGPGESQLETDRRIIRTRIAKMKERVEQVRQQRETAARGRDRRLWPTVGIVGYTNAGKSTLLNALVGSEVAHAEDKLFATLDPTSRQVKLGDGQTAIVTDTVGFIHKLPHQLVDAFRATLEEVNRADVLIEVVDASDAHVDEHRSTVQTVLDELGAGEKPRLVAFNKADLVDRSARNGETPGAGHRGRCPRLGADRLRDRHAADRDLGAPRLAVGRRRRRGAVRGRASCSPASASAARSRSSTASATCASTAASRRRSPASSSPWRHAGPRTSSRRRRSAPNDERPAARGRLGHARRRRRDDLDGRRGSPGPALARGRRPRATRSHTRSCSRPGWMAASATSSWPGRAGSGRSIRRGTGPCTATMSIRVEQVVRHVVGLPFGPDDLLLVEGSPLSAAAIAWRLASSVPAGESTTSAGVVLRASGELDEVPAIGVERLAAGRWRVEAGRPFEIDAGGLPVLADGETRPLEVD